MMAALSAFDMRILEALFTVRDSNLIAMFIWISMLGRAWLIYAVAVCVVLILVSKRKYAYAFGLSISVASAGILILILKGLVERARPPGEFQAYLETWYSFPSAHAALAVALYGFLLLLAWRRIDRQIWRYVGIVGMALTIILVSLSRIYLGVHYPSDVLGGVLLGSFCVWLGWKYAKIVRNGHP
ncbi:phosphatase PAP2 family protein [Candidatus Kaiserbacteria bacterium]|nr:phosphatase PAP2 family protein [Candidatus Kaiserbacteria bacterium]